MCADGTLETLHVVRMAKCDFAIATTAGDTSLLCRPKHAHTFSMYERGLHKMCEHFLGKFEYLMQSGHIPKLKRLVC